MRQELVRRRQRVLEAIAPGVLLVPAAPLAIRNNDVEHEYRQDSDFFYLTGFDEPESVLVLSSLRQEPFVLFVRPRDPEREVWDGSRAGVEGAVSRYGADEAHPFAELSSKLAPLLENAPRLFYRLGLQRGLDEVVLAAIEHVRARAKHGVSWPTEISEPSTVLHEMRLIKSEDEIARMRRAATITAEAHLQAMACTQPGMYEYELEALLRSVFLKHGSRRTAYEPIVGSGPNATVLHYRRNDRPMRDGELILIDAGCEYEYYAADVTRTFPVSGRFSLPQRRIYDIVLEAQLASIDAVRPGATLEDVHRASVAVIARGLVELGLLEGPVDKVIEQQSYKPYFMHRTSHWLGMDVHDVGTYYLSGKPRPLEASMVLTVEPGIYIAPDAKAPEEFRGIGVRIEDDVLVTSDGREVLSRDVAKQPEDVERACAA
jgi:Xaa-Pro aminopeptidase